MLQKYPFVAGLRVNHLQDQIDFFFKKIRKVSSADVFDPDTYFPPQLAVKVKAKVKNKAGNLVNGPLYNKSKAFFDKFKKLGVDKENVYQAFITMNKINGLFEMSATRITISDLPAGIQKQAKSLFVFLYEETLSSYGIKNHYETFSKLLRNNWCPFCGLEQLVHFTHQKEDYDHLLAKSIYPFAAVNMRNLAPMGVKCNRIHKKAKDLIWDSVKQIKAVNPYSSNVKVAIDFDGSVLPKIGRRGGSWQLQVLPNKDEVHRWDFVFNIRDRIIKDVLTNGKESEFDTWINDFINLRVDEGTALRTLKQVRQSLHKFGSRFDTHRYKSFRYIQGDLFKWIAAQSPDPFIQSILDIINKRRVKP